MRQITLALTHHNRFSLLLECLLKVKDDPRISEIVISDDASSDGSYQRLQDHFRHHTKVKLFQNEINLDCYANKRAAVDRATNEWVILFDSDNVLDTSYLDYLFAFPEWDSNTVYCPDFAEPHFDYRNFAGITVDRKNVASLMKTQSDGHPPYQKRRDRVRGVPLPSKFATALNTCNYFVNRASYLEVWDGSINPHTADSIFQAYNWLRAGKRLLVVPGLRYFHRVHDGSHYKNNFKKTGKLAQEIESKLKEMR